MAYLHYYCRQGAGGGFLIPGLETDLNSCHVSLVLELYVLIVEFIADYYLFLELLLFSRNLQIWSFLQNL